jgi:hypothetical protein
VIYGDKLTSRNSKVWAVTDSSGSEIVFSGTLPKALDFLLIEPHQVGPDNMGGWLHTDGRTYLYDPATSGYRNASALKVGDVIAYAGRPDTIVLRTGEPCRDTFDRPLMGHWCRRADTGEEGWMPYGHDGMFPVRFDN